MTDDLQAWLEHSERLAQQDRRGEAMAVLEKLIESHPAEIRIRDQLIKLSAQQGDYAAVIFHQMDCAELYQMGGDRIRAMERYEVILRLEETVQTGPHSRHDAVMQVRQLVAQVKPEIYLRIGEFRLANGQLDQAQQYLRKSLELKPGIWDVNLALGKVYLRKEMFKECIGELQEVVRLAGDTPGACAQAYELLGQVFVTQGRPEAVTRVWFENAATQYEKAGEIDSAQRVRQRLNGQAPVASLPETGPPADFSAALDRRARGDYAGALSELDRLLLQVLTYRGECLQVLERHSEAAHNSEIINGLARK